MATLSNEQIEQKKQQFLRPCGSKRAELERKQLTEKVKQLKDELVEAGALPLDENDLNEATGGWLKEKFDISEVEHRPKTQGPQQNIAKF